MQNCMQLGTPLRKKRRRGTTSSENNVIQEGLLHILRDMHVKNL